MIFVTDKGRMANNIFQYGQLYAWGREHHRPTMSMRFAHMYPEFRIAHTRHHNWLVYVLVKLMARMKMIPTVEFNDINSDNAEQQKVMLEKKNVLATGWCVRFPDLFDKYRQEIVDLFQFNDKVHVRVQSRLGERQEGTLRLGVHLRRGDYATWCHGTYFFDDATYIQAIRRFLSLVPDRRVDIYICGNDPKLNRAFCLQSLPQNRVVFPDGSPAEDLCLFSECDYLLGPPSSFTLIAQMYHDARLCWLKSADMAFTLDDFYGFSYQARHIDDYYI
jgi:hypothetical protein